ncbi:MAG: hypothetical protein LBF16_15080 [Pseudomonadales bacterium]|nr:hypothetical protein [Pseudomonadales bacterium]
MDINALDRLRRSAARERAAFEELTETPEHGRLAKSQSVQLGHVKKIGQGGDFATIVASERFLIQNELDRYANSPGMKSSLTSALMEIGVIERHLPVVVDPVQYKAVNAAYSLPRSRRGGLPYDEARQALNSHYTRLGNLDKSRLTAEEKAVIGARRDNIKIASAIYLHMQTVALGS